MAIRRPFWTAGLFAALLIIAAACGDGSPGPTQTPATQLSVAGVERVFITRPLGPSLRAVLLYLQFGPSVPPSVTYEATGTDGRRYKGVFPGEAKICGFPAYLGIGLDAGREGSMRTIAFIVPAGVNLTELRWRTSNEAAERSVPLPDETVVCTPPIGS